MRLLRLSGEKACLLGKGLLMDFKIYKFDETTSTNTVLKEGKYPVGSVAVARCQSGGRGRGGRLFRSPSTGLYMSVVFGFETLADKLFMPVRAAVDVCDVLREYTECGIKWPNDIVAQGKKLCGILAEGFDDRVIIGIGINVNTTPEFFRENGLPYATSLYIQTGREQSTDKIFNELLEAMGKHRSKEEVMDSYKKRCQTLGREIRVIQGNNEYNAAAVDLTECGELVVIKDGQRVVVNSGEVSVRSCEYA